jgi:hypothetical protein
MGTKLKTAIDRPPVKGTSEATPTPTTPLPAPTDNSPAINPNDFENIAEKKKGKEMNFNAQFEGITLQLAHKTLQVIYTNVSGFSVEGKDGVGALLLTASMQDVLVEDPQSNPDNNKIVSKTNPEEKMINLTVTQYKLSPRERAPEDLGWTDTDLRAEFQRVKVQLSTAFLGRILDFAKALKVDLNALKLAARATADTATAAAAAIRESEKTAHRVKLDLTLHAPLILLPYTIKNSQGSIAIDLGRFHVHNRFVHGESLLSPLQTIGGGRGLTTFDVMEIQSTAIEIHRSSTSGAGIKPGQTSLKILEPVQFTATITRNLGNPLLSLPNVDINLPMGIVKVLHSYILLSCSVGVHGNVV